jgi:hypothetical protein
VKCVEEERNFRGLCTITVTVMGISWAYQFFAFVFWVLLGFELRTSCILGRHSTTWTTPPALFSYLVFFS